MELTELRALALQTVAERYQSQHHSTDELLREAERVAHWLETGDSRTREDIERQGIGEAMREMIRASEERGRKNIYRCATDLIEDQPGEVVAPPHFSSVDPQPSPHQDLPFVETGVNPLVYNREDPQPAVSDDPNKGEWL